MARTREVVLASRNPHKLRELSSLLAPLALVRLPDDVELPAEVGASFAENSLIKARAAARATGRAALADDSGIEVAALGGAPGVRSARYAGEHATDEQNLTKLLDDLSDAVDRRAAYVCVLALVEPVSGGSLRETVVEGRCEGMLIDVPRGSGGFGYDPAFVPNEQAEQNLTMAEISEAAEAAESAQAGKDAISHRGAAAARLLRLLEGSA
ncbi:MAG: non-canonical purine NTP pyrophosphatase [Phycisphaeraceae bacterium]